MKAPARAYAACFTFPVSVMTRLPLLLIPLVLAACAAVNCQREDQIGSAIPRTHCRSASQRAADRAAVDEMNQALKNHPGQSPMPTGGK
jgi:hypothetical protein